MNNPNQNHPSNNSKQVATKLSLFCKENKKQIIQLLIVGVILFFIYIFVFYQAEIRQGFLDGWQNIE